MKIETPRLIIRPFQEKDADALYRIKTDPRVMEYCPDFLDVDAKREDMLWRYSGGALSGSSF